MKQTRLDVERRRALALLAESPDGCIRAVMLARGFSLSLLNRLVRAGLATSHIEREERGYKAIESVRVKITEAGRRTIGVVSIVEERERGRLVEEILTLSPPPSGDGLKARSVLERFSLRELQVLADGLQRFGFD